MHPVIDAHLYTHPLTHPHPHPLTHTCLHGQKNSSDEDSDDDDDGGDKVDMAGVTPVAVETPILGLFFRVCGFIFDVGSPVGA